MNDLSAGTLLKRRKVGIDSARMRRRHAGIRVDAQSSIDRVRINWFSAALLARPASRELLWRRATRAEMALSEKRVITLRRRR